MAQRPPCPVAAWWAETAEEILDEIYEERYARYEESDNFGLYWHDLFS